MNLPPLVQSFVLHFGEMGSRWGINRTVGQIYALLFVSPAPLCAEEIAESLGISRSNVSMSLRELQAIHVGHVQVSDHHGDLIFRGYDRQGLLRIAAAAAVEWRWPSPPGRRR